MTTLTILTVCMKWSKRSKRSEQIFISRMASGGKEEEKKGITSRIKDIEPA